MEKKVEMSLALITPLATKIDFDAEGAKAAIESLVAPYHGLVVTDDNVKDMEGARKELTSYRTRIEKFRKETKKAAEEPIKAFEMQVFDILKLITDEEDSLKGQLQKYEDKRIEECREKARGIQMEMADSFGLREEYRDRVGIPAQVLNKGSWTAKGALNSVATKLLERAVQEILHEQEMDDERKRIIEMNRQSVVVLCQNLSEKFSLNTPVAPEDLPPGLVENCQPQDLEEKVRSIVAQRAEVERRAAETAALAAKAQAEAEAAQKAQQEEAKPSYKETMDAVQNERQDKATAEMMEAMGISAETPASYTVVLTMHDVPADVVEKLKAGKKLLGCSYELEVM